MFTVEGRRRRPLSGDHEPLALPKAKKKRLKRVVCSLAADGKEWRQGGNGELTRRQWGCLSLWLPLLDVMLADVVDVQNCK
ncbi:MAG: hypothetical protein ACKESB_02260 [Candidatus Hodgkinia cicadicola]